MKNVLLHSLKGRRLKNTDGTISPVIVDIRMVHFKEPDTPMNDWWGREWDELCVVFDNDAWNSIPVKDCLNCDVI
jgi:endo-1,4-beta-mannosidase